MKSLKGILKDPARPDSGKSVTVFNAADFLERNPSNALTANDTKGGVLALF